MHTHRYAFCIEDSGDWCCEFYFDTQDQLEFLLDSSFEPPHGGSVCIYDNKYEEEIRFTYESFSKYQMSDIKRIIRDWYASQEMRRHGGNG